MGDDAARGMGTGAPAPAGRGKIAPGAGPYLRLAEVGYLGVAAVALVNLAVLAVTSSEYVDSLASTLVGTVLSLVLLVAWVQLGRKQGISWFIAAGAFGGLSAVISLAVRSEPTPNTFGFAIAFAWAVSVVSLIYFATQLLAFNSAANSFQVRPFKYAAYLLAGGFVVSLLVGSIGAALAATQQTGQGVVLDAVYGLGGVFSVAMALAAWLGFHRLRGLAS
jgi:hypothetical protein